MSYGEATELFTSLSKLWRMFKKLCPCLEICCPNVWPHKPELKESMMPETFCLFAQKRRTLETSCDHVLIQYTKRVAYKDGHCWGQSFDWGRSRDSWESDAWKRLCSILLWASKVYQELIQSRTKLKRTFKMFTRCKFCGGCKAERIKLVAFTVIRI